MNDSKHSESSARDQRPLTLGITGATGGLGTRLLSLLRKTAALRDPLRLRALVRSPAKLDAAAREQVQLVTGDLGDPRALAEFSRGLDVCIHLASQVGHSRDARQYFDVNVRGTERLCEELVRNSPTCHLIHCSSLTVLLRRKHLTWMNTDYANSKYGGDVAVRRYQADCGLSATIVYPGLIYGPEDRSFVPTVARHLRAKHIPFYVHGGESHSPAIYIDDLCELFTYVVNHRAESVGHEFIGVGPQEVGIHEFLDAIAVRAGCKPPTRRVPRQMVLPVAMAVETAFRALRIAKEPFVTRRAVNLLSISLPPAEVQRFNRGRWAATTNMHDGLSKAFAWYRENGLV